MELYLLLPEDQQAIVVFTPDEVDELMGTMAVLV
jgi:hypothetical protein